MDKQFPDVLKLLDEFCEVQQKVIEIFRAELKRAESKPTNHLIYDEFIESEASELIAHAPMSLKMLRKNAGLTQKELAEKTGISQSIISSYENGIYTPDWSEFIPKMVQTLKCTYEQFFVAIKNGQNTQM